MLEVRELCVADRHGRPIVEALSFSLPPAGSLAIVGESGSGKTQAALSLLGLQDPALRVGGSVRFDGAELLGAPASRLRALRGARIGFVFQDPSTSLNPYLSVGLQIAETIEAHRGLARAAALAEARRLLEAVRIGDAARRLAQYPHELSGGMRQRVMIAIALAGRPQLLIADEPTTALDVTVQQQLIGLLAELRQTFSLALLLITHDLGLVAELCERTLVLYAGQMMEEGQTSVLLSAATHPYTRALLRARPHLDDDPDQPLRTIPGALPARGEARRGCVFAPRCAHAQALCRTAPPPITRMRDGLRRCHFGVEEIGVFAAHPQ
ncbi:ABC transporter ATP-binding protein [Solimonas flava]|uniref:ABC transporter ATP-binding protein n=1 Tax=Solimonas flava TaxID=415849 RepID=UPI0003F786B3|nr:ABC transporter ATP-binding protein [Solimonas flava]